MWSGNYKLVCLALYFLCTGPGAVKAYTLPESDSILTLYTATLHDGTKLFGTIHEESGTELRIYDFNLGDIRIPKGSISKEDRQKLDKEVILETVNDNSYFGRIIGAEPGVVLMRSTLIGVIEIQSNTIVKVTTAEAYIRRKGGNWFANPNATRYLFAPSAIPLKKGEGYYQNAYILANSVSVGLNNNLTLGGGVVIPLLFYVTPKISYKVSGNLYLGAGILFTQSFITDFKLSAGIGYGIATVGNEEHNFTLGAGYGFSRIDSQYTATKMPILTINGMTRITRRISIVTENWLMPRSKYSEEYTAYDPNGMPYTEFRDIKKDFYTLAGSLGMRFMPNIKTSVDFSVVAINLKPKGNYILLPYLDFVYKFN